MAPMRIRNGNYRLYQQSYDFGFGILIDQIGREDRSFSKAKGEVIEVRTSAERSRDGIW